MKPVVPSAPSALQYGLYAATFGCVCTATYFLHATIGDTCVLFGDHECSRLSSGQTGPVSCAFRDGFISGFLVLLLWSAQHALISRLRLQRATIVAVGLLFSVYTVLLFTLRYSVPRSLPAPKADPIVVDSDAYGACTWVGKTPVIAECGTNFWAAPIYSLSQTSCPSEQGLQLLSNITAGDVSTAMVTIDLALQGLIPNLLPQADVSRCSSALKSLACSILLPPCSTQCTPLPPCVEQCVAVTEACGGREAFTAATDELLPGGPYYVRYQGIVGTLSDDVQALFEMLFVAAVKCRPSNATVAQPALLYAQSVRSTSQWRGERVMCVPKASTPTKDPQDPEDCVLLDQSDYRGFRNTTKSGIACQAWSEKYPHTHNRHAQNYPAAGLEGNYCRNPDGEATAWCYTLDPAVRDESCGLSCGGHPFNLSAALQPVFGVDPVDVSDANRSCSRSAYLSLDAYPSSLSRESIQRVLRHGPCALSGNVTAIPANTAEIAAYNRRRDEIAAWTGATRGVLALLLLMLGFLPILMTWLRGIPALCTFCCPARAPAPAHPSQVLPLSRCWRLVHWQGLALGVLFLCAAGAGLLVLFAQDSVPGVLLLSVVVALCLRGVVQEFCFVRERGGTDKQSEQHGGGSSNGSIVSLFQQWFALYKALFGMDGIYFHHKQIFFELVEVTVQSIDFFNTVDREDSWRLLILVSAISLNCFVSPLLAASTNMTVRRAGSLFFDSMLDLFYVGYQASRGFDHMPLITLLTVSVPSTFLVLRLSSVSSLLAHKRRTQGLPRRDSAVRHGAGEARDTAREKGQGYAQERHPIELDVLTGASVPMSSSADASGMVVDADMQTTTGVAAAAAAEEEEEEDEEYNDDQEVEEETQERVGGAYRETTPLKLRWYVRILVAFSCCFGLALFVSYLSRLLEQDRICREQVGAVLWDSTSPKVLFPDGYFRNSRCSFEAVGSLDLSAQRLEALPVALQHYTALAFLSVHSNELTTLPTFVGQLPLLHTLDVRYNRLQPVGIPYDLALVWSDARSPLRTLRLQGNPLEREVMWSQEPRLTQLPAVLSRFWSPTLMSLYVINCSLLVVPGDTLLQFPQLRNLSLAHNRISSWVHLQKLDSVELFNVSHNYLEAWPVATRFSSWSNLRVMDVGYNLFDTLVPDVAISATLEHLGVEGLTKDLNLNWAGFSIERIPDDLSVLPNVDVFRLGSNLLTAIPAWLAEWTDLDYLLCPKNSLREVNFTGPLRQLAELDLSENLLTSVYLQMTGTTSINYQVFILGYNPSLEALEVIWPSIRVLHISGTALTRLSNSFFGSNTEFLIANSMESSLFNATEERARWQSAFPDHMCVELRDEDVFNCGNATQLCPANVPLASEIVLTNHTNASSGVLHLRLPASGIPLVCHWQLIVPSAYHMYSLQLYVDELTFLLKEQQRQGDVVPFRSTTLRILNSSSSSSTTDSSTRVLYQRSPSVGGRALTKANPLVLRNVATVEVVFLSNQREKANVAQTDSAGAAITLVYNLTLP